MMMMMMMTMVLVVVVIMVGIKKNNNSNKIDWFICWLKEQSLVVYLFMFSA